MADADVVVVDRIAPSDLALDGLPARGRGDRLRKSANRHNLTREINEVLRCWCERARAGQRVVRLTGGAPVV